MADCPACAHKEDKCSPKLPGVIQINNPPETTLFHKVVIPASMGDETDVPPKAGLYKNVLLVYETNAHVYMYSSDGIPTSINQGLSGYTKSETDALLGEKQDTLTAGTNIQIVDNVISANPVDQTFFYANSADTGITRHLYKNIALTSAATAQDLIDASNEGLVILRSTTTNDPNTYNDSVLVNVFVTPDNTDWEFVFIDGRYSYNYAVNSLSETEFSYDRTQYQSKLTAGENVTITGSTISATDTTYDAFTGTDGVSAGTTGLVPAPAATDADKVLSSDGTWKIVEGGVKSLSTENYDYPDANPTGVALWRLAPGIYQKQSTSVNVYANNAGYSATTAGKVNYRVNDGAFFFVSPNNGTPSQKVDIRSFGYGRLEPSTGYNSGFVYVVTNSSTGDHQEIINDFSLLAGANIEDSLTSNATTKVLSAKQGKVLNDKIPVITMTSTDPGEGYPLAANNFMAVYNA